MLGRHICDPHGVESHHREIDGIGLLDIETNFENKKTSCRVEASITGDHCPFGASNIGKHLHGYEIHMGTSSGDIGIFRLRRLPDNGDEVFDGSIKGHCWGTYIHGIFDNDLLRRAVINGLRAKKHLPPLESRINYAAIKDRAIDGIAAMVKENIHMEFVDRLLKL
jgi:adenosylcobyric acid synthase